MMNPWVLLGVGVLWLLSLVGVGKWQREDGAMAEKLLWQSVQNEDLRTANREIERLNKDARKREAEHQTEVAKIGGDLATTKQELDQRKRDDAARARAGDFRLRVPGTCPVRPDPGGASAPSGSSGRSDGREEAELPREVAAALFDIVNDADAVVAQLTACQAVVRSDRKETP